MIWVLVAVIVVLVIVVALMAARARRSRQLRDNFGPEYDRVVSQRGGQRAAEKELIERRDRVSEFEIRELDPAARAAYQERWQVAQRDFVDTPRGAVNDAHLLVQEVMRERGYPVDEDFEQRAADVSVEHPGVVENYRAAHGISLNAENGNASTEDMRQAMVHFRALFDDLLGARENAPLEAAAEPTTGARGRDGGAGSRSVQPETASPR
jgi:hypothetical protein